MDESGVQNPEGRRVLLLQRAAADELARRRESLTLPGPPSGIVAELDAPGWNPGDTIARYEAVELHRGNLVVEIPSRHVEATFARIEEARVHADQLNKWLAARPTPDRRYRLFVPPAERTEAELIAMIDAIYEPEAVPLASLAAGAGEAGDDQ